MTETVVKPALFTVLWTLFVLAFASFAHASDKEGVKDLQAIHADYVKLAQKKDAAADSERNKLQHEVTSVINRISDAKTKKLSNSQIRAFASVIAEAVPRDPIAGVIGNNLEVMRANRKALDREFARLPKAKRKRINEAIKVFEDEEARGTNDTNEPEAN